MENKHQEFPQFEDGNMNFEKELKQKENLFVDMELPVLFGREVNSKQDYVKDLKNHIFINDVNFNSNNVSIVKRILQSIVFAKKPFDVQFLFLDANSSFSQLIDNDYLWNGKIEFRQTAETLKELVKEVDERYNILTQNLSRNLKILNNKLVENGNEKLPYLVIIIENYLKFFSQLNKFGVADLHRLLLISIAVGFRFIITDSFDPDKETLSEDILYYLDWFKYIESNQFVNVNQNIVYSLDFQ